LDAAIAKGFGSTDFSLWGSVSKPGLFLKAKIDGPHACENSLQSKISASSNGTPQTEVCATETNRQLPMQLPTQLTDRGDSPSIGGSLLTS
jgi:hypothetical protein